MSGFASLSLLFTGSEDNASEIKDNLNKYFSQNSLAIGKLVGQDFSQLSNPNVIEILFSADLTEIHLVALAQWFGCRFALFENGIWKRYGKWNNFKTYLPIVLMEKKDGKYSPIFSLKE
uniref:Uncharacterized protein n=1 Tax=Panagrolaimus sp. ES5 TaxID=591445 RepID=A0AC34GDR6_9BILA